MDGRSALVLGLVLSSCGGSDDRVMGPAFPATIGPADDPGSDPESGEEDEASESGSMGDGSSEGDGDGTTSSGDAETTAEGATSGADEVPAGHCDPLAAEACPADQMCAFYQAFFKCLPDSSGPYGGVGEACQFANVCDPGLFCAFDLGIACPDGAEGCCAPYCDLTGGAEQCPAGNCVPYFPDGSPFPWLEALGYCDGV